MTCPYLHKLCPKPNCDNWVCRAYFPERQPTIRDNLLPVCMGENYEKECPNYIAGRDFRERRHLDKLKLHCPFATNNECGKPDNWMCKGRAPPFRLYPAKDEDGVLLNTMEQLKETCLSGKREIYIECPFFKEGLKQYNKTIREVFKDSES